MKDAIGQEIQLGDVLMHTKNFYGYSSSYGMTFATKFGSTNKIGTTQTSEYKDINDYVSYADCKNVVVFTEQAIKFYGEDYVNKMRKTVVIHKEQVKEKGPITRYFIVIERDYNKPNVTYETFIESPVYVIQVEGKTKQELFGNLGKKLQNSMLFTHNEYIILERKGKHSYGKVPVKYSVDAPYSLKKLKEFGLENFVNQRVSPECLKRIFDFYNYNS